jgi:hypothetical protein
MAADDVTDFSVYYFNEGLRGAPQLSGTSGALIAVLDACLITGFGTVSVTSLTVADGIATATVSAGNGFNPHHIILIEGASDPALNGRHRVLLDGNSSTSFSFKTTAANGTASGTISAKYAPVPGWEKPFSAANKAVYRATTGNRFFYRVDDSLPEKYVAEIRGYETMTSVDVGVAPFPLLSRLSGIEKSNGANATGKYWDLVADCRAVMFGAQQLPTIGTVPYPTPARYFGEMVPLAPNGDAWCSAVLSSYENRSGSMFVNSGGSVFYSYRSGDAFLGVLARGLSGVGAAISAQCMAAFGGNGGALSGQDVSFGPAPSAVNGQLYLSPVYLAEGIAGPVRAVVPGAQFVPHTGVNGILGVRSTITPAAGPLAGRQLLALACSNYTSSSSNSSSSSSGRYLMDITGPWRTA